MKNTFMSITDFKSLHLVSTINIKRNLETGKLFCVVGTEVMKVQQDFNPTLPSVILVNEGKDAAVLDNCCLINYDPTKGAEDIASV